MKLGPLRSPGRKEKARDNNNGSVAQTAMEAMGCSFVPFSIEII
jgi:hypothetical protein